MHPFSVFQTILKSLPDKFSWSIPVTISPLFTFPFIHSFILPIPSTIIDWAEWWDKDVKRHRPCPPKTWEQRLYVCSFLHPASYPRYRRHKHNCSICAWLNNNFLLFWVPPIMPDPALKFFANLLLTTTHWGGFCFTYKEMETQGD